MSVLLFLLIDFIDNKIHDQLLELLGAYHTLCKRVILAPRLIEGIDAVITDPNFRLCRRGGETFKDDRDEEIQKDEADHQNESDEVEVGYLRATALYTIELL